MVWSDALSAATAAYNGRHAAVSVALGSDGPRSVLTVGGWLGLEESTDLQALLSAVVDSLEPADELSLDLSAVTYISSTGVGALSNALVRARKKGTALEIAAISRPAERILGALGILRYFQKERSDA